MKQVIFKENKGIKLYKVLLRYTETSQNLKSLLYVYTKHSAKVVHASSSGAKVIKLSHSQDLC